MLQGCFHLLRGVLGDEKPAWTVREFVKNYDVFDLLKLHSKSFLHHELTGLSSKQFEYE